MKVKACAHQIVRCLAWLASGLAVGCATGDSTLDQAAVIAVGEVVEATEVLREGEVDDSDSEDSPR